MSFKEIIDAFENLDLSNKRVVMLLAIFSLYMIAKHISVLYDSYFELKISNEEKLQTREFIGFVFMFLGLLLCNYALQMDDSFLCFDIFSILLLASIYLIYRIEKNFYPSQIEKKHDELTKLKKEKKSLKKQLKIYENKISDLINYENNNSNLCRIRAEVESINKNLEERKINIRKLKKDIKKLKKKSEFFTSSRLLTLVYSLIIVAFLFLYSISIFIIEVIYDMEISHFNLDVFVSTLETFIIYIYFKESIPEQKIIVKNDKFEYYFYKMVNNEYILCGDNENKFKASNIIPISLDSIYDQNYHFIILDDES